jgi:hypothetical protein
LSLTLRGAEAPRFHRFSGPPLRFERLVQINPEYITASDIASMSIRETRAMGRAYCAKSHLVRKMVRMF